MTTLKGYYDPRTIPSIDTTPRSKRFKTKEDAIKWIAREALGDGQIRVHRPDPGSPETGHWDKGEYVVKYDYGRPCDKFGFSLPPGTEVRDTATGKNIRVT